MFVSKIHIILTFILTFAFTIAKSQDLTTENSVKSDIEFLFQNTEKSVRQNVQAIVIPESKKCFSGFDAAKTYSKIDKNKKYKKIIFVYTDKTNSRFFEKHIEFLKVVLGDNIEVTPIAIDLKSANKKTLEAVNSEFRKDNLIIVSEDIANILTAVQNFEQISIETKKGSPVSNWKILVRK